MSRHWQPPKGNVVRIRRAGDWTKAGAYGGGGGRMPEGARAGLVLIGAACIGVAIGAYQVLGPREIVAPEAAVQVSQKIESVAPPPVADPQDREWTERAKGQGSASAVRRGSGRAVSGVRASFTYCKWGGGTNCVVDGDTIYLNGAKIRIANIDAPETHDYRCNSELELGERAARQLQAMLNSGAVTMTGIDRDRDKYGRLLRNVAVNGQDVGEVLMSAGLANRYVRGKLPWC